MGKKFNNKISPKEYISYEKIRETNHPLTKSLWQIDPDLKIMQKPVAIYEDGTEALLGGLRILKGACERADIHNYELWFEPMSCELFGMKVSGSAVSCSVIVDSFFVPFLGCEKGIPSFKIVNGDPV